MFRGYEIIDWLANADKFTDIKLFAETCVLGAAVGQKLLVMLGLLSI